MATSQERRLTTAEDLHDLPEDARVYELVAGQLISGPLPGMQHGAILIRRGSATRPSPTPHGSLLLAPRTLGSDDLLDGGEVLPGFSAPVRRLFDLS